MAYLATEFAASVDGLSYAAVLPVAADELDGRSLYAPALTATGVVTIAFMAAGPFLYGRVGPRVQLWIATVVWLAGAALTVTAPTMEFLVAGMAVRGIASGLIAGLGLGVISGLYPDPRERERALGLIAFMWVVPALVGPAINAPILATLGWRPAMAWPAAFFLVGRVLVSRNLGIVQWKRAANPARVRGAGAFIAIAVGIAAVQAAVVGGAPVLLVAAVMGVVVVLAVPYRSAVRATVPGAPQVHAAGWMFLLVCASYFGINTFIPLLAARLSDPTGVVGAVLVSFGPLTWGFLSVTGLGARVAPRTGYRLAAVGFPAAAAGLVVWTMLAPGGSWALLVLPALVAVVIGGAMGVVYPKIMALSYDGFSEEAGNTRAHGGAVLGLSENVGTAMGVTMLAGVGAQVIGLHAGAITWLAAAFALTVAVAWRMAGRSRLWQPSTSLGASVN